MQDTVPAPARPVAAESYRPAENAGIARLHRRFPTVAYLRRGARRKLPHFAFEYCDGGAGADGGICRNWTALDAVELVPRYGGTTALPPIGVELFGRSYSAPIGVAPMGGPSLVFPGAERFLAAACQQAKLPYTLGLVGALFRPAKALADGTLDLAKVPTRLQLVMAGLCLVFVLLCVRSFVEARRRRTAGG